MTPTLISSIQSFTLQARADLEREAHQAIDPWPERVKAACLTNRLFGIAHGMAEPEEATRSAATGRIRRKKPRL